MECFSGWKECRHQYCTSLQVVTARQMIAEIDLAFRVWKENVYSRDCPFEEFCEYILPFYRGSFVLDGSRADFANEYKGFFSAITVHSMPMWTR